MSTFTYCGLPTFPLAEISPPHDDVAYLSEKSSASMKMYEWSSTTDTHWIDISHHVYRFRMTHGTYVNNIRKLADETILVYIDKSGTTSVAFQSEEEMMMAMLKYPEIFINATRTDNVSTI